MAVVIRVPGGGWCRSYPGSPGRWGVRNRLPEHALAGGRRVRDGGRLSRSPGAEGILIVMVGSGRSLRMGEGRAGGSDAGPDR